MNENNKHEQNQLPVPTMRVITHDELLKEGQKKVLEGETLQLEAQWMVEGNLTLRGCTIYYGVKPALLPELVPNAEMADADDASEETDACALPFKVPQQATVGKTFILVTGSGQLTLEDCDVHYLGGPVAKLLASEYDADVVLRNSTFHVCTHIAEFDSRGNTNVEDCHFDNCTWALRFADDTSDATPASVSGCTFTGGSRLIAFGTGTQIKNCRFDGCDGRVLEPSGFYPTMCSARVEKCTFKGLTYQHLPQADEDDGTYDCNEDYGFAGVEQDYVLRHYHSDSCLLFAWGDEDAAKSVLRACKFVDCHLSPHTYLVQAVGHVEYTLLTDTPMREQPLGAVVRLEHCMFEGCSSQNHSRVLVKRTVQYDETFNKDQCCDVVEVSRCHIRTSENAESERLPDRCVWRHETTEDKLLNMIGEAADFVNSYFVGVKGL